MANFTEDLALQKSQCIKISGLGELILLEHSYLSWLKFSKHAKMSAIWLSLSLSLSHTHTHIYIKYIHRQTHGFILNSKVVLISAGEKTS